MKSKRAGFCGGSRLINPFIQIFKYDFFSHVRAHHVAESVLKICRENKAVLVERPDLVEKISKKIFQKLDEKTKHKYAAQIEKISGKFAKLMNKGSDKKIRAHIPSPSTAKLNSPPQESTWQWPSSDIGLSSSAQQPLKSALDDAITLAKSPENHLRFIRRNKERFLQVVTNLDQWEPALVKEWKIPLSLIISYDSQHRLTDIILLSKKMLTKGGQTQVRVCASLATGGLLVRKKSQNVYQHNLMLFLQKKSLPGIVMISYTRATKKKFEVIEPLYSCTLDDLLKKYSLTFERKLELIMDLLSGLASFHSIEHDKMGYNKINPELPKNFKVPVFQMAHRDIKPANILIKMTPTGVEAAITDFGSVNPLDLFIMTGFTPPETLDLLSRFDREQLFPDSCRRLDVRDTIRHNLTFGQSRDQWSLGLVFVMILVDPQSKKYPDVTPLSCVEEGFTKHFESQQRHKAALEASNPLDQMLMMLPKLIKRDSPDSFIKSLTQAQIDTSLQTARQNNIQSDPQNAPFLNTLWDVISQMVRIDPEERITSKQALEKCQVEIVGKLK